ncbi:MAG: DivIVA domain-containing protein [Nocardioides sp.]
MPLTPEDVSNKRFTPVRLREGYDMGEVDQFLDEVEAELARLVKQNDELRAQLDAAQGGMAPMPAPVPVAAPEPIFVPEPEPVVAEPVVTAPAVVPAPVAASSPMETIRVETVPQASNAAARLLEIAANNAEQLEEAAKDEADKILSEARFKADRLETESKERADKLESDARTRAQMLDSETSERRQQMFGELEKQRDRLSVEVENLRSFEREYRSRLKTYFTQQLESLTTTGDGSPVEPEPAPRRARAYIGEGDA